MRIQTAIKNMSSIQLRSTLKRATLLSFVAVLAFSSTGLIAFSETAAAQSVPSYCNKYKETLKEACGDGYNGGVCEFWLTTDDEAHRDACEDGSASKNNETPDNNGGSDGDSGSDSGNGGGETPTEPGRNTSNSEGDSKDQLKNQIDKLREVNKEVNKNVDANSVPDNNYGQYVNGAGKLSPINVRRSNTENAPAIIFFNGGGWLTNDGMGAKVAPKANERGYATFEASYRLGSSGVYYQLEDVMRAVKHVRDNAGMYGIDPAKIAIWGDSAGGSLTMRAAGTGQSGAAAAVGWSAPTNAYTALFHSPQSFAIGMVHSTCAPTDLNGASDVLNQLNGGEAIDPETLHDGGIGNFGNIGNEDALSTVVSVLEVAQQAQQIGQTSETLSKQLEQQNGTSSGESSAGSGENVRRLASKKVIECLDNFNTLSPALFANALTPPTFLAGYEGDPLVHPGQAYQMRDKLRTLGINSEALILPGQKHLGFEEEMVKPSLDFLDKFINQGK